MWRVVLSHPLPVLALVSLYLTNKLIGRFPIPRQQAFAHQDIRPGEIIGYYPRFPWAIPDLGAR